MSEKDSKKLKVNPCRIIGVYAGAFLLFEVIFYASFQGVKLKLFPPDKSFYFYTPALLIATAIFCILSLTQTYYEIKGATFIHSKMGRVVEYSFSNIIYIDEEFSEKKKLFRFFTREGKEHLLLFDKNGELYQTALKKCNTITLEEFERRFPNIKM